MKQFFQKIIKERFRITFFHDDFKPVFSLRFTLFTLILFITGFATLIIFITTFIIANTSLKEYIPGHSSSEEKYQLISLMYKMDSLQTAINNKNTYIQSVLNALQGKSDSVQLKKNISLNNQTPAKLSASENELKLRDEIKSEFLNHNKLLTADEDVSGITFLPPTKGVITSQYNPSSNHYGIDLVGKNDEPVRSVFKGIVVFSGYSLADGNFIIISHPNGFTSIYKHLSMLFKQTGSPVHSNEIIGTMGNTGIESKGNHLHFELWYKDTPQNPLNYISM